tara:strand:- start:889 stop:1308 length:420 start_codon:yes stop_codon:yes gene_type:complete
MINRIFSLVEPGRQLHMVCHPSAATTQRTDIVGDEEYLQLAILNFDKGRTFTPHKHIEKQVPLTAIAQESWVVIRGKVKAYFYDLDDNLLCTEELNAGDVSITLYGGHNYEILEDDTLVLEYKTGPYYGQKLDKVFIDG